MTKLPLLFGAIFLASGCNLLSQDDSASKETVVTVPNKEAQAKPTQNNEVIELGSLVDVSNTPDEQIATSDEAITSLSIDNMVDESLQAKNAEVLTSKTEDFSRPHSEGNKLPTYASSSNNQSCDFQLNENARSVAYKLTQKIEEKVKVETGEIYIVPTIIPDQFVDCIQDVSNIVRQALKNSTKFKIVDGKDAFSLNSIAQNKGSSALIPLMIREARAKGIPYLATTIVRTVGNSTVLTVRFVKALDGVTLSQSYEKIDK